MTFYQRKPNRIPNYNYASNNYYFVTICTHEKQCIFGTVEKLNSLGLMAENALKKLSSYHDGVFVDNFKVMPNHIHAIIVLENAKKSVSEIVALYKAGVTRQIRKMKPNLKVWQRSFHDHVIRNEREYQKIWQYVKYNEQKWTEDCYYAD